MTNTDSLFIMVYCSKNRDAYDIMIEHPDQYDFRDVSQGCDLFDKIK